MKRKKYIKQLMALGVQRNDAAGFVSAYRACVAAGKEHLLPDILQPAPIVPAIPIIRQPYKVAKFAVTMRSSDNDLSWLPREAEDINKQLAREMGLALLDAGAICITMRDDYTRRYVEYRATISVAMEETA